MRIADRLRITVVIGAAIAALGSATAHKEQQKGYYPRKQPAPQPRPQAQPGPVAQPEPVIAPGTCEHFCGYVARCRIETYAACFEHCKQTGRASRPGGRDQLIAFARSSCEQLVVLMHEPPTP